MKPDYALVRWRLLAAVLDVAAILVVLQFVPVFPSDTDATWVGVYVFVVATAGFNYFAFCEWRWGRTMGKLAIGLDVRTDDGERPSWSAAAMRGLFRLVDLPLTLLVIGAITWARSPKRQRLGDRVAHTVVLRTRGSNAV